MTRSSFADSAGDATEDRAQHEEQSRQGEKSERHADSVAGVGRLNRLAAPLLALRFRGGPAAEAYRGRGVAGKEIDSRAVKQGMPVHACDNGRRKG